MNSEYTRISILPREYLMVKGLIDTHCKRLEAVGQQDSAIGYGWFVLHKNWKLYGEEAGWRRE